jgi:excisionase family DNA binding protein
MGFISRDILLPPRKAAEYTGLDRGAIKHLLDSGQLPYEVIGKGGVRRVRKSELDKLMNGRKSQ